MTTETQRDSAFTEWYRERIGEPSTTDESRGYWVFVAGILLGVVGILLFTVSGSPSTLRGYSVVIAAVGLVLLLAGPLIRLPLQRRATLLVYLGVVVCAVAIVWFFVAYPSAWRPQSDGIVLLYSAGLLAMAFGGVFVPLLTPDRKYEEEIDELEGQLEQLREALEEAEADEEDLARLVDQLRQDQADTAADEEELAAQLRALRSSQARFEHYEDRGGEYRWRLRHRNGNVIADSGEGYTRRHNARKGMQSVRRNALGAEVTFIESVADADAEAETDAEAEADAEPGPFEPVEEVESQATFEFYEDSAGEWRWRLRHDNGNIVADGGQGYASKSGVRTAIDRVSEHVGPANYLRFDPTGFEIYMDAAGQWRWRLLHRNGNILADGGEGYTRRHDARRAVDRIRERVDELEFEVFEDAAGEYRWRLVAGNDEIVADSGEGYTDRGEAENAVERVRNYAPDADVLDIGQAAFEVYEDSAGEWRWRLRHRNGNIVADGGQGYADRTSAVEGIESVKRNAPNAEREQV